MTYRAAIGRQRNVTTTLQGVFQEVDNAVKSALEIAATGIN